MEEGFVGHSDKFIYYCIKPSNTILSYLRNWIRKIRLQGKRNQSKRKVVRNGIN